MLIGFTFIYGKAAIEQNMYLYYAFPIISGWFIWFILIYEKVKKKRANKISVILMGLVMLNLMTNATNLYYPYGNNSISKMRSEEHTSELQSRFALVC